jgi:hypothetical protein
MRLDPVRWAGTLLALVLLVLVVQQTVDAVGSSGVWSRPRVAVAPSNPYAELERLLAAGERTGAAPVARDPFAFGRARTPLVPRTPSAVRRAPDAPPPPVLTAIFWDDDPRAILRWNGRDYAVRADSLVGAFRVARIMAKQVILERGTETLVLTVR